LARFRERVMVTQSALLIAEGPAPTRELHAERHRSGTDVSVFPVQRSGQLIDREGAEIRQFSNIAETLLLCRTMTPLLPPSKPSQQTGPARILPISVAVNARSVCVRTFPCAPSCNIKAVAVSSSAPAHHAERGRHLLRMLGQATLRHVESGYTEHSIL